MSRPATPTKLKILKGSAQPCRMLPNEAAPRSDRVEAPDGLSPEALKQWDRVRAELYDTGIVTNLDVHALALYCEAYARYAFANEQIQKFGPVVNTPNEYPVQSPWLQIANKSFDQMMKVLSEFGMTPSSRTRVSSVKKSDQAKADWSSL